MEFEMQRAMSALVAPIVVVCGVTAAPSAYAQAGFEYRIDKKVETTDGYPTLILQATGEIDKGTVTFKRSDGRSFTTDIGAMDRGDTKSIDIKQPTGVYEYEVSIDATGPGEESVETTFKIETTRVTPLKLSVDPRRARIDQGKVPVRANRAMDHVDMKIFDSAGHKLYQGTQHLNGNQKEFIVQWPPKQDVGAIRLKAYDGHGFWKGVLLEPFWVEIPHEEVTFDFGKASWNPSEEPKLEATLAKVRQAMKKHRDKGLELQLYIAGYTDTVGSKADNRRLSTARARSISRWFQKHGLDIPIYYQGFGESVLAVQTGDDTKNAKNRRAIYVLGNARPPTSKSLPRAHWKRIQ